MVSGPGFTKSLCPDGCSPIKINIHLALLYAISLTKRIVPIFSIIYKPKTILSRDEHCFTGYTPCHRQPFTILASLRQKEIRTEICCQHFNIKSASTGGESWANVDWWWIN